MKSDAVNVAAARVEAAAAFLMSPFLVARIVEGMQAAAIRAQSPWLNRQDAADYARCGISEIDRAAHLKIITKYQRGGAPLFKRAEIDAVIENGKWTPGTISQNAESRRQKVETT